MRRQALIVGENPEAALAALPALLPPNADCRAKLSRAIHRIVEAGGPLLAPAAARLHRIDGILAG